MSSISHSLAIYKLTLLSYYPAEMVMIKLLYTLYYLYVSVLRFAQPLSIPLLLDDPIDQEPGGCCSITFLFLLLLSCLIINMVAVYFDLVPSVRHKAPHSLFSSQACQVLLCHSLSPITHPNPCLILLQQVKKQRGLTLLQFTAASVRKLEQMTWRPMIF